KGEKQIGEIPLGIDREHRHAVDRGLLDDGDAESRLATAGHPDTDRVGEQVLRIVQDRIGKARSRGQVVTSAEIEESELFVRGHARLWICRRWHTLWTSPINSSEGGRHGRPRAK